MQKYHSSLPTQKKNSHDDADRDGGLVLLQQRGIDLQVTEGQWHGCRGRGRCRRYYGRRRCCRCGRCCGYRSRLSGRLVGFVLTLKPENDQKD